MNTQIKNRGFIALMSAILISAVLLALLVASNMSSFYARFDVQDAQSRQEARGLAEACADAALLRLAQNYQYDPAAAAVAAGDSACTILSITPHAPRAGTSTAVVIDAQASEQSAFSAVEVGAVVLNPAVSPTIVPTPPDITLTFWHEE